MSRLSLVSATAMMALASVTNAQDADLLVFDYSGYELPEYHGDYIKAHGASPSFALFGDEEEAFKKLASGFRADVAHIFCDQMAGKRPDRSLGNSQADPFR